jgi:hypothetical protein
MPENDNLLKTYQRLAALPGVQIEPFEVISTVEHYRHYWKPETVKTILLAESYVYTSPQDFSCEFNPALFTQGGMADYARSFVRFVYCLGYGEDEMLREKVSQNSGTPQFWKIFYSCVHPTQSNEDFSPILKNATGFIQRMRNKIALLREMKEKGVWLLDASILALYGRDARLSGSREEQIITTCWNGYIHDLILANHPHRIICIGKGVANILTTSLSRLHTETGVRSFVIPQPQAHLSAEEHLKNFQNYYRICNM